MALNTGKASVKFHSLAHCLFSLQAVDDMNGKELNGRQVYVGRAQKKGERQNELKRKFEQMKQDRMTRYQVGLPILFHCIVRCFPLSLAGEKCLGCLSHLMEVVSNILFEIFTLKLAYINLAH